MMRSATLPILSRAGPLVACAVVTIFGIAAPAMADTYHRAMMGPNGADSIRVLVNGDRVHFNAIGPRAINGRMMVPLRGVLEKSGATVDWEPNSQTVTATRGDMTLQLSIGSRDARLNGRDVRMDVPAMAIAGNTMVPLRFVSESLGGTVAWDDQTRTVSIETADRTTSGPGNREIRAEYRTSRPRVDSITHDLSDRTLAPGQRIAIVMHGTPGGQAWFRIRGSVGESKMRETESGVYEGAWRNATAHSIHIDDHDVLAFIVRRNVSSPETMPDGSN